MRMVFPNPAARSFSDLATDVGALVESIFHESNEQPSSQRYTPQMDVEETDESFILSLDLPGVSPDDVHVDIEEHQVTIHGKRLAPETDESKKTRRRIERAYGDFRRVVKLPKNVEEEGISAGYDRGVLTVTLPKAKKLGSRRVEVSIGGESSDDPK